MSNDLMPDSTIAQAIGMSEMPVLDEHIPTIEKKLAASEAPFPDSVVSLIEENALSTNTPIFPADEGLELADPNVDESDADKASESPLVDPNVEKSDADKASESPLADPKRADPGSDAVTSRSATTDPVPAQVLDAINRSQKPTRKGLKPGQVAITLSLVSLLLALIIVPTAIMITVGIGAYTTYKHIHDHAYSGYNHFLNLKPLVTTIKAHPTTAITPATLDQAKKELLAARGDFTQVQNLLEYTPVIQLVKQYFPQYRIQITTVQSASRIGIDVADIGLQLTNLGTSLGPRLHSPLLSDASTPLITANDLDQVHSTIDILQPLLDDIQGQSHDLNLDALPLSASQRLQLVSYLSLLPQVQTALVQSDTLFSAVAWLLGVDGPRTFLVQPMDRAEIRATGGFTGQYGELTLKQGRVEPFSMRNIALLEYADNSYNVGQDAPLAYRSWWPFANWGLRDSNLSADFPTSAKIAIDLYKKEAGRSVDGVVMLTPFAIEDVLKIVGPLHIPTYNETITAQNLEDRLHYYQLGPGIATQKEITHLTNDDQARKQFTSELGHVLMDAVRHAPPETLLQIAKQLLYDLKTRDLQIYVQNAQIENLLIHYGYAGLLDRSTSNDGLYIVQSNVSASKASQYVRTIVNDTVKMDQYGGIIHSLRMQLIYNQVGPVYGLDTYRDYVRFYVPTGAVLRDGNGFDNGQPLCGGPLGPCASDNVYPHNELVCPSGQYDAGYAASMLNDPYVEQDHPLDNVGKPTNLQSDEPGRAMFGGYVVIPKNCTATVTLSWSVPPIASMEDYQLLIQRQAGTFPEYHLMVSSPSIEHCNQAILRVNQILQEDLSLSLKSLMTGSITTRNCASFLLL